MKNHIYCTYAFLAVFLSSIFVVQASIAKTATEPCDETAVSSGIDSGAIVKPVPPIIPSKTKGFIPQKGGKLSPSEPMPPYRRINYCGLSNIFRGSDGKLFFGEYNPADGLWYMYPLYSYDTADGISEIFGYYAITNCNPGWLWREIIKRPICIGDSTDIPSASGGPPGKSGDYLPAIAD